MSLLLAAVLIIGGLVGAAAIAVGIPLVLGIMAYDIKESRKTEKATKPVTVSAADARFRIAVERGVARAFVLTGGIFWSIASFAGLYSFRETGATAALMAAFIPAVACIATLIVGWYFERTTAAMLLAASLAVIAWGVIYQFEAGVWAIMTFALIGPMMTASVLFWLARREQEAFETAHATRPELAWAFSARSSLG